MILILKTVTSAFSLTYVSTPSYICLLLENAMQSFFPGFQEYFKHAAIRLDPTIHSLYVYAYMFVKYCLKI